MNLPFAVDWDCRKSAAAAAVISSAGRVLKPGCILRVLASVFSDGEFASRIEEGVVYAQPGREPIGCKFPAGG